MSVDDSLEFEQLLDDLTSIDNTSGDESSLALSDSSYSLLKVSSTKIKHVNKKRKIDVLTDNGALVTFEAGFPRPRVIRTDIRRSYANMYINTMNSGDFTQLFGFMDTFCNPHFNHSVKRQFTLNSQLQTCSFQRSGVAACAQFWCYNFVTIPDATLYLTDTTIISCDEDNTSKIVAHYVFKATKIFDCSPIWREVISDEIQQPRYSEESKISVMKDIVRDVECKVKDLTLRSNPLEVTSLGEFTIFLDEHKRMLRMEMSSKAVQQ